MRIRVVAYVAESCARAAESWETLHHLAARSLVPGGCGAESRSSNSATWNEQHAGVQMKQASEQMKNMSGEDMQKQFAAAQAQMGGRSVQRVSCHDSRRACKV